MPHTIAQWFWFVFWGAGSLGGWIVLVALGTATVRGYRQGKAAKP